MRINRRAWPCWIVLLATLLPGPAGAVSPPDSLALASLQAQLVRADLVRVTSPTGSHRLRDVRLDATGIVAARWGPGSGERPALIVTPDAAPPARPGPIPWSQIGRLETGEQRVVRTALGGLVAGAALGAIVWRTIPTGYDGGRGDPAVIIGVPALLGGTLGMILGMNVYRWRTVYPSAASEDPR